jgi:hypothetical protein
MGCGPSTQQPIKELSSNSSTSSSKSHKNKSPKLVQVKPSSPSSNVSNTKKNTDFYFSEKTTEKTNITRELLDEYLHTEKLIRQLERKSVLAQLQAQQQEQRELDERISVIADFVEKTGRAPQDWFIYQQLNPSEMDDMTAIQVQMASDYPNLSQDEIGLLLSSKYKTDPDLHSEDEVRLSQLQMKIDAENARKGIDEMRLQYQAPERQAQEETSLIDDNWVSNMQSELAALDGIDFDLGNGNTFTFGMDEAYKGQLAEKNARLDEFFDPYVREDGSWDYDMLNMHRAVIDNVDKIVQSVYRQGMADAQRSVVQNAANATPTSPNQGSAPSGPDPLVQQLKDALGQGGGGFGFI